MERTLASAAPALGGTTVEEGRAPSPPASSRRLRGATFGGRHTPRQCLAGLTREALGRLSEELQGMDLSKLARRDPPPPWSHGGKIPWDDPEFSERMLREHLSQHHDLASRRFAKVDAHVAWLHELVPGDRAVFLDLGCGPGFYCTRLAKLGHCCHGIDFSPSSIDYARAEAKRESLDCTYRLADILETDLGQGFDVALFTYGEFNTFPPADARLLLDRIRRCLNPGGMLVLEVQTDSHVRALGHAEPTWHAAERGLFSNEPYLCLKDCFWCEQDLASTERFTVVPLSLESVDTLVCTTQAYADAEYDALLRGAGFGAVEHHPSLSGDEPEEDEGLLVLTAQAPAA